MPSIITVSSLASSAAYTALVIAGVVLWRRRGSVAEAAIAIGFALVLLEQVIQLVDYLEISAVLRGHPSDTLYIVHHHAFLRYAALLGLWLAAAGLVWHAVRTRNAGVS